MRQVYSRAGKVLTAIRSFSADLSSRGGGERYAFHRSHQSGRDADLLYYLRDAGGQPPVRSVRLQGSRIPAGQLLRHQASEASRQPPWRASSK